MKIKEIVPAGAKHVAFDKLEAMLDDDNYVGEVKEDGWRWLMHFGGGLDRVYMTGRRPSKKAGGALSEKGLCARPVWPLPKFWKCGYTVFDGEILPPLDGSFNDIAGIMNVEPAKAQKRIEEIGNPRYRIFDVLFYRGEDVRYKTYDERRKILMGTMCFYMKSTVDFVSCAASNKKRKFYESIVKGGGEGIIMKRRDAPYGVDWYKLKKYVTLDVVICGYTEANEGITGKYSGLIGAIKVGVYRGGKLIEVGQVSGMTDDVRVLISKNPGKFLNTVIEIKAQEMAKDRLRHPRWSRPRPDVSARKCTWEKLLQDLQAVR